MGGHFKFGKLDNTIHGITYYHVSPHELKPFHKIFRNGCMQVLLWTKRNFFLLSPFVISTYLIYDWANKEAEKEIRKKPGDYINDQ